MYKVVNDEHILKESDCTLSCCKCWTKYKVGMDQLKFSEDMKPFVCELCTLGIEFGDKIKLEKFILDSYKYDFKKKGTTIVDFVIDRLSTMDII